MFILTSKYEGFSLAVVEALAEKTPVITYDIEFGPTEIINNDKLGFIIKEDTDELAKTILKFMKLNISTLHEMYEACYKRALDYSFDNVREKYQQYINLFE